MKKFAFIVLVALLFVEDSSATEVSYDLIQESSYHIQIGAFASDQNVKKAINKLHAFDVYIERYKGLNRVIVVNIMTKNQLNRSFSKIKKFYPKSFITKRPTQVQARKVTKKHSSKKPVKNYDQLFESLSRKKEIIQQHNDTLNSNTILKTRKSFL